MPRRARLELPGVPLHITHRGVNRAAVFIDDLDRTHYLDLLQRFAHEHSVCIHAYVLMDNHVHLLTSAANVGATSRVMRRTAQCHTQAFNRRHRRTGTLWEGRFKSCLVGTEQYVLKVYRYIELNPIRARMVERPERFAWSSVHANLGRRTSPLVTPHAAFLAFGEDNAGRAEAYANWLREPISDELVTQLRSYIAQERALGDQRFQAMVEKILNRPARVRPPGRQRTGATKVTDL